MIDYNLYTDFETIPGQHESIKAQIAAEIEAEVAALKAPGNWKDPAKIQAYLETETAKVTAAADEKYRKCSFNGARGELVSMAFCFGDNEATGFLRKQGESEADLIRAYFDAIKEQSKGKQIGQWVGHNILDFDLKFLFHRCVILGVAPTITIPHSVSPSDARVYDTMTRWSGWGKRISQDDLCAALGLPGKQGMDGSMVYDAWLSGAYGEILEYNKWDVKTVRSIFRRMTFA